MPSLPLDRFTVLDLTRVRSGPTCVRQFADFGANVIKIDMAEGDPQLGGPREGSDFQNLQRNKRAMTLNLKAPLVINLKQRLGRQVISSGDQPVQYALEVERFPLRKSA